MIYLLHVFMGEGQLLNHTHTSVCVRVGAINALTSPKLPSEVPPTPRQPTVLASHLLNHHHHHPSAQPGPSGVTSQPQQHLSYPQHHQQQQLQQQHHHHGSSSSAPASQTDSRWISSLRRRDPELQPTLPSINHHLTNASVAFTIANGEKRGRSSKLSSSVRKSRSVERFRARKVCDISMTFNSSIDIQ